MKQTDVTAQLNLWKDFINSFTLMGGIHLLYEHLSIVIGSDSVTWDSKKRCHFVDVTNVMTLSMIAMYNLYQPLCEANAAGVQVTGPDEDLKEHFLNLQELNQGFGQKDLDEHLDEYVNLFMQGFDNYSEQSKLITIGGVPKKLFHLKEKEEVLFTVKQFCNMFRAVIDIDLALLQSSH